MVIYVGDARDVINRIRFQHCSGNVEGSAFRRQVAQRKGYRLSMSKRSSGATRIRLDLPDPKVGETQISAYIRSGEWRYCLCGSVEEAKDFQWYVIEKLNPLLNVNRRRYAQQAFQEKYALLLDRLIASPAFDWEALKNCPTGPGVYVFYHRSEPQIFSVTSSESV